MCKTCHQCAYASGTALPSVSSKRLIASTLHFCSARNVPCVASPGARTEPEETNHDDANPIASRFPLPLLPLDGSVWRRHRRTHGSLSDRRCGGDDRGHGERRRAGRVDGRSHGNQRVGGGRIDRQLSDGRCSIGQRATAVQEHVGERHRADCKRRQRRARADSSAVERFNSQHRQRSPLRRKGAAVPPYRERHVSVDRRQRQR